MKPELKVEVSLVGGKYCYDGVRGFRRAVTREGFLHSAGLRWEQDSAVQKRELLAALRMLWVLQPQDPSARAVRYAHLRSLGMTENDGCCGGAEAPPLQGSSFSVV
jgi:hypothetical protein